MKVLWLTNLALPIFEKEFSGKQTVVKEGWVTGLFNRLKNNSEVKLGVCFPFSQINEIAHKNIDGAEFYAFPESNKPAHVYDPDIEVHLKNIVSEFKPDIVQIWGTEYPHALAMTKVFNKPDKTIIHIQGLCSIIAQHYFSGLNERKQFRNSLRDIIRNDNLFTQRRNFILRGENEIKALENVNHIIGRTSLDKTVTGQINHKAKYHFCGEILRDEFYRAPQWDINNCQRHSIFISQTNYTIKGFHFVLQAMPLILRQFPNAHIYTTGEDFIRPVGLRGKLRISGYQKYTLLPLIKKYRLENHITFLGCLSAEQMKEQYLKANVHINPSSIENSSNSVAESRLLGVPTVASYVGGSFEIINHNKDGFCYQHDAPYMLAGFVSKIFDNDKKAAEFSANSISAENERSNPGKIANQMLEIYIKVGG